MKNKKSKNISKKSDVSTMEKIVDFYNATGMIFNKLMINNKILDYLESHKHHNFSDFLSKLVPDDLKANMYYNAMMAQKNLGDNEKSDAQKLQHYDMAIKNLELSEKLSGKSHNSSKSEIKEKQKRVKNKKQAFLRIKSAGQNLAFNTGTSQLNKRNTEIKVANFIKNNTQQKIIG